MFSGLSNFLKDILPKRLFYRALLIVAVPVLVLQLVITIVLENLNLHHQLPQVLVQ